jgi:threonine dehydratase
MGTICGQGTVGLEIAEQVPEADVVLVGCGGGGLYSGLRTALDGDVRVVPAEPARCPNLHAALAAGRPVPVAVGGVAADSLGPAEIGATAFGLAHDDGIEVPLVSDDEIIATRRWLWQRCRLLAEPGASVALAALMTGAVEVAEGDTVVVVVSGGNNPVIPG